MYLHKIFTYMFPTQESSAGRSCNSHECGASKYSNYVVNAKLIMSNCIKYMNITIKDQ